MHNPSLPKPTHSSHAAINNHLLHAVDTKEENVEMYKCIELCLERGEVTVYGHDGDGVKLNGKETRHSFCPKARKLSLKSYDKVSCTKSSKASLSDENVITRSCTVLSVKVEDYEPPRVDENATCTESVEVSTKSLNWNAPSMTTRCAVRTGNCMPSVNDLSVAVKKENTQTNQLSGSSSPTKSVSLTVTKAVGR